MKLYLKSFEAFPARWQDECGPDRIKPAFNSILAVDNCRISLDIQKAEEEYYCQGELSAGLRLECSRCLELYETEIVSDIDFIVCSLEHYESLKSEAVDNEDYVFIDSTDLTVDITKPIEQALILAVSLKPLCDENCLGICAMCGKNLNQSSCDCKRQETDPRWDALKGLSGA